MGNCPEMAELFRLVNQYKSATCLRTYIHYSTLLHFTCKFTFCIALHSITFHFITYMHTCMHTYTHTCMHAYIHPCMHALLHHYITTSLHYIFPSDACIHEYMALHHITSPCTLPCTSHCIICLYTKNHTYNHTYIHVCIYIYIHEHIHEFLHYFTAT